MFFLSKPPIRPPAKSFTQEQIKTLLDQIELADQRKKLRDKFDTFDHHSKQPNNFGIICVYLGIIWGSIFYINITILSSHVFFKALLNYSFRLLRGISCHNFLQY